MERRFARLLALVCVVLAALPTLYGLLGATGGRRYVGFQTNVDDHMVYAAWTWQAAHGALTFDDRFAVDPQPGLTFHLYFLLVGQLARGVGVVAAMTVGRLLFTGLFVLLLAKLVRRLRPGVYGTKLALASAVVAGGVGFLPNFWHRFGAEWPVDVWQPEGFVAPSMLTNGLFMVSLCLVLSVFLCVLRARRGDRGAVVGGALAMAALMNVHSYDALLVGLVLLGFLAASLAARTMTAAWAVRATLIVLGALPPALWFVHVLREDPVFAARAATPTYSPNFRLVFLGFLPPLALAFVGLYRRIPGTLPSGRVRREEERKNDPPEVDGRSSSGGGQGGGQLRHRRLAGLALATATLLTLLVLSPGHREGYFLSPLGWVAAFGAMVGATALLAERSPIRNLLVSWALVGTVAIYFPALFERKLTMGLAIPWGLLAALALESLIKGRERSARNLVTTLALLVLGGSAVRWTFREVEFATMNVASTGRHPVYLSPDAQRIIDYLNAHPGRNVVVTVGPRPIQAVDDKGEAIPDTFVLPAAPDIAPFLTGLAGAYTVAGHWSETPDYPRRAGQSARFLLAPGGDIPAMTGEERARFLDEFHPNYAVVPLAKGFASPSSLGEVVVQGSQLALVRLAPGG